MSCWNLPGSPSEWTGDTPADEASVLLQPLARITPKKPVDGVLDALEVVLRDGILVSDHPLGERTLYIPDRPRNRAAPTLALVEELRRGLPKLAATYRDEFQRAPTLRELVYSISFVFVSDPAEYTSDGVETLKKIRITA